MSQPTIRIESCRSDGRCPECEAPLWVVHSPTVGDVPVRPLPCGCATCSRTQCVVNHLRALLTEALRQLSERTGDALELLNRATTAEEERDAAIRERTLARAHDTQPYPTAEAYERACAALEATKRRLAEAAMELPEIAGPVHHRIQKFREMFSAQITKERERAEKAEALLRKCDDAVREAASAAEDCGDRARAREWDALLAKIREALS